jgi:hypothetical protein
MSFLGSRNAVSIGVSPHVTLGGPNLLNKLSPSLILQFAGAQTMDPRITFTRASTATFTGSNGLIQTAAINAPRFDYNPTTLAPLGLLIEEQRTNLVTYSEQFDNAAWTKTASSITANTVVAPDGTLTGDGLVEDTATSAHAVTQSNTVVANTTYTASCYFKAFATGAARFARIQYGTSSGSSGVRVLFDLSNGTISAAAVNFGTGSGASASITAVGNNWYRCTLSGIIDSTSTTGRLDVFLQSTGGSFTASYTGNGYSGIYIWGAQLEAGAFPTSYIQTVASQVTRAADAASMTGANFSSWYNQAEGTLFINASPQASNALGYALFEVNDTTASNRIGLFKLATTGNASMAVFVGGAIQANINNGAWTASGKLAGAYAVNNFASVLNGGAASTDISGTLPLVTQATIGARGDGGNRLTGTIKQIVYYPRRLTNSELQAITA